MDDLDLVRTVLDDIPPASAARLAAGRARLAAATTPGGPPSPRRSSRWPAARLAGVAMAGVAMATAAIAFAATSGGGAPKPRPPVQPARPQVSLTATVLAAAARTVASHPAHEPRPRQWFYYESISTQTGQPTGYDNEWITFDGIQTAYYESPAPGAPARLIVHHAPASASTARPSASGGLAAFDHDANPLTAYHALASLPASPSALLAAVRADIVASHQENFGVMGSASTTAQKEFAYLGQLLWNSYAAAPPSALAAVYRAVATIPGVTVNRDLNDAAGSPAVGITDDRGATEILLDPRAYRVIGINLTTPGPVTNSIAYLRIRAVSRPGQR